MKKITSILLTFMFLTSISAARAGENMLRPINVQNAYIDTDKKWEARVSFDWFHDHRRTTAGAPFGHDRRNFLDLPRLDIKRSLDTAIPTRIGMSTALVLGTREQEFSPTTEDNDSGFGFGNIGLTLEAALLNERDKAITAYINQNFPLAHRDVMLSQALRPLNGTRAYGFQTGAEYQFKLVDNLNWFGDIAYRFDVPSSGSTQHSLVYYNELVLDTGTPIALSCGLLGNSVYTHDLGTDLRLVPGIITSFGDRDYQFRVGAPIGLTSDSADFGVQASLFAAI
jgi:hypothetical protein